jgi:hypothetical protein
MQVPPNDSLFWPYLRQGALLVFFVGFGLFAYYGNLGTANFITLFSMVSGTIFGIDMTKRGLSQDKKD